MRILVLLGFAATLLAQNRAAELVRELGELPPVLVGTVRSDGTPDPLEERMKRVHRELRALGTEALPEIATGLADQDVRVRRGAALYLAVAASTWGRLGDEPLDIRGALPALILALVDADGRTRNSAAQAVEQMGPDAVDAVPALITMLGMPDEGSRLNACAALGKIGTAARAALPVLRKARDDPKPSVRRCAHFVVGQVSGQPVMPLP